MSEVKIGKHLTGSSQPLYFLTGPCVLEDPDEMMRLAEDIISVCNSHSVGCCFKASYTKDNRTSGSSYRGPGMQEGLRILENIKKEFGVPIVTDIHHPEDAATVAEVADVLQIPAFLCRQSSLLEAAAKTGAVVNVKKGQFLAPEDMSHVVQKIRDAGCGDVLATERGSFFGYRDLIVDFRSISAMKDLGVPVVFDATHSVQTPGSSSGTTGGKPELVPSLTRCGVAAGADILFIETHYEPARAKSDAGSQLPFEQFDSLVENAVRFRELYLEMTS